MLLKFLHVFNLTFCSGFARLWPGKVCGTIWDSPAYVRPLGYQDEPYSGKDIHRSSSHASLLRIGNVTHHWNTSQICEVFFSTAKLVEVRCLNPPILCWMAIVQTYRSTDLKYANFKSIRLLYEGQNWKLNRSLENCWLSY